ncbi:MAG: patatin-like phospholipase family protein [Alphaproteobacteria bacterium]|nr:patatin-like phospholipase family protein [Alphaproteobacteria bacterium]
MAKNEYKRIALACQGGGSLGAYHIGAYQAMQEAGYLPDVVSGISIGAFTAALIAGNNPENRMEKLKAFWDTISWPEIMNGMPIPPEMRKMHNSMTSMQGFIFGQPNFFEPRVPGAKHQPKGSLGAISHYDTSKLKGTLLKFVDFDRINSKKTQLLLGATRIKDGQLVFFDSAKTKIGPEHVMASGAFPPGFPPVEIDGEMYWDGGCVSNTPLEGIYEIEPRVHTLVFMIDLFNPIGEVPKDMEGVSIRTKDIMFTSRTAHHIEQISKRHNLKKALGHILAKIPADLKNDPIVKEIKAFASDSDFDIVHILYNAPSYEVDTKDCEFSKTSIKDRSDHGYTDMKNAVENSPWLREPVPHAGCSVHKFHGSEFKGSKINR